MDKRKPLIRIGGFYLNKAKYFEQHLIRGFAIAAGLCVEEASCAAAYTAAHGTFAPIWREGQL